MKSDVLMVVAKQEFLRKHTFGLNVSYTGMLNSVMFFIQWKPVNSVTNGPQKYGCINGVAILKDFFEKEKD